jgi:hypothetical protein
MRLAATPATKFSKAIVAHTEIFLPVILAAPGTINTLIQEAVIPCATAELPPALLIDSLLLGRQAVLVIVVQVSGADFLLFQRPPGRRGFRQPLLKRRATH